MKEKKAVRKENLIPLEINLANLRHGRDNKNHQAVIIEVVNINSFRM